MRQRQEAPKAVEVRDMTIRARQATPSWIKIDQISKPRVRREERTVIMFKGPRGWLRSLAFSFSLISNS